MTENTKRIILFQFVIIIVLFWLIVFYGKDEFEALTEQTEEEIETPNRVANQEGTTIITISPATQKQSDIDTTPLKSAKHQASINS